MCVHGGRVMLAPRQSAVLAGGAPVLCEGDLVGAPIVGCLQPVTPATKPCTAVLAAEGTSLKVIVGGRPAHTAALTGVTDGVPPGTIMVVSPGQVTVNG
jgi:hypothetical protein